MTLNVKCSVCGKETIFAQDPYNTPGATKYWASTYKEPETSLYVLQRKTPSRNKKGKTTVQVTNEHILAIFCSPECGLEYNGRN